MVRWPTAALFLCSSSRSPRQSLYRSTIPIIWDRTLGPSAAALLPCHVAAPVGRITSTTSHTVAVVRNGTWLVAEDRWQEKIRPEGVNAAGHRAEAPAYTDGEFCRPAAGLAGPRPNLNRGGVCDPVRSPQNLLLLRGRVGGTRCTPLITNRRGPGVHAAQQQQHSSSRRAGGSVTCMVSG